ncbi:MAG: putative 4-mercaptohistidine N1-methyltransferase [Opitutales bacterium]
MNPFYESEDVLAEYLLFHYGKEADILPFSFGPKEALDFPVRCVSECLNLKCIPEKARALDLGCSVGRSSFELARHCHEVIGIDNSASFIGAASQLREMGEVPYASRVEGELRTSVTAQAPGGVARERVAFQVGDALDLPPDLGTFDVLLMANLIDRLPRPAALLERLPDLVQPNGQLIIVSPYTWMEQFTPREHWLGGFERDGRAVTTFGSLREILSPAFTLDARKDLPFLIREHARKYQWSVAEATVWRRRR